MIPASVQDAARDIASMRVRGAAALAMHAARALAQAVPTAGSSGDAHKTIRDARSLLLAARPTAVSLRHALDWVSGPALAASTAMDASRAASQALSTLDQAMRESRDAIATHAVPLLASVQPPNLLTHCNSSLAIACITAAHAAKPIRAIATESRPFGQGLITARQLASKGIPCTLIVDSAVAHLMARGEIGAAIVGADAISTEGDLVNKVGTHAVATLAAERNVPFWCAAPFYKFSSQESADIPIEERSADEVASMALLPQGVQVRNPVFDVTPAKHVQYLTEEGPLAPADAVRQAMRRLPKEVSA